MATPSTSPLLPLALPGPGSAFPALEELLPKLASGDHLLVCRTRETARALVLSLLELTEKAPRAWAGLRVATLSSLMAEATPAALLGATPAEAAPQLPADHPWAERLAARPGLRRLLRGHLEKIHLLGAAGGKIRGLRPELEALRAAGYGASVRAEGVRRLLRRGGGGASVVSVGFGPPGFSFAGQSGRFEQALLAALGAMPLEALPETPPFPKLPAGSLRTLDLPDAQAEARAIARCAARDPRALVLVPDEATSSRVRAALSRNGLAVADRGFSALSRHALVALLRPLVPLFGSHGEEPVNFEALLHLIQSPVLSRRALEVVEGAEGEAPRLSLRHARELLLRCRRLSATLPEWRDRLRGEMFELVNKETASHDEAARKAIGSRLSCAQILHERLDLLLEHARRGTLGALARFIRTVGLSNPSGDRLGQAVCRALSLAGGTPATPESFEEALGGTLASSRVESGITVLAYEDYDGRTSGLLLCAGVHDKGLGRPSSPDPFLTQPDFDALGCATGQAKVKERVGLLRWAVARSSEAIAFFARTDASGRRVSFPSELAAEVAFDVRWKDSAYGLELASTELRLPELSDLTAVASGAVARDGACRQIDTEWARSGAVIAGLSSAPRPVAAGSDISRETLEELLRRQDVALPQPLRPYLGYLGPVAPKGPLPEGMKLSATRLADFTQCLYRAFCAHVLKLKPPEDVEEEYTPSEIGDLIHNALSGATKGVKWLVPAAEVAPTRARLTEALCRETERIFTGDGAELGSDLSPAIHSARRGVLARWKRHWAHYVESRVQDVTEHNRQRLTQSVKSAVEWPEFGRALSALGVSELGSETARKRLTTALKAGLADSRGDAEALFAGQAIYFGLKVPKSARTGVNEPALVRRRLELPATRAALSSLCARFGRFVLPTLADPSGDEEVVAVELPFDETMALGGASVPVNGRIDSVLLMRGQRGPEGGSYKVVDYKTGKKLGNPRQAVAALVLPQLVFYALALQEHLTSGRATLPNRAVRTLAYDQVKTKPVELTVGAPQLDKARDDIGALLNRARGGGFPLLPHPAGCPLVRGERCDFAEACRFRAPFDSASLDEVHDGPPEDDE